MTDTTIEVDGATIVKSDRRRRTIAWRWVDGRLTVRVPARYTRAQIAAALELIRKRAALPKRTPRVSDSALVREAEALNKAHFDGTLMIGSIRYAEMTTRRGSCSLETGDIRISTRLATVPAWVRQAVIHHELCHLLEPDHGPGFAALEARYLLRPQASDYLKLMEHGLALEAGERDQLISLLDSSGALPDLRARLSP